MAKFRTIIVIDSDHDLHGMTPQEYATVTQGQLADGDIYVDEYMEIADNVTITVTPND